MCQPKLSSARSNSGGRMPRPHDDALDDGRGDGIGQPAPQRSAAAISSFRRAPCRSGRGRPQASTAAGARRREQQGRDQHDQLMLDHVHGEAALARFVQRRGERQGEHRPAGQEQRRPHRRRRALRQTPPADEVDQQRERRAGRSAADRASSRARLRERHARAPGCDEQRSSARSLMPSIAGSPLRR